MTQLRSRRWLIWLTATLLLLAVAGLAGFHFATRALKSRIEEALGPRSEVTEIVVGLTQIEIKGIRIHGDKDWPAADELSAQRVSITPDWDALLSRNIRIAGIRIEDGYVSMLRRKDGKLVLLPSLLKKQAAPAGGDGKATPAEPMPEIRIGGIELTNAAVDFFDASVRQPAHKLRLEQTNLSVGRLLLPALTGQTSIRLEGVAKGVQHDGKVAINGWMELASKDSEMSAKLSGVDLVAFQPYLIKAAETGVKRGTLDLDLKSTVKKNRLHAPGKITLTGLELSSSSTFMGMPRDTVARMMQNANGRIEAEFTLDGNIDDPRFSLNEKFLAQVGIAAAGALGISLEGLITGVGGAGGSAAQGIGSAIGKLFGEKKK